MASERPHNPVPTKGGDSFGRVSRFMKEIVDLSPAQIDHKVKKIEPDLYALFKKVERVHSLSDKFQQVDLSEDMYTLLRMLEHRKVVKRFPFLSRAAGLL